MSFHIFLERKILLTKDGYHAVLTPCHQVSVWQHTKASHIICQTQRCDGNALFDIPHSNSSTQYLNSNVSKKKKSQLESFEVIYLSVEPVIKDPFAEIALHKMVEVCPFKDVTSSPVSGFDICSNLSPPPLAK